MPPVSCLQSRAWSFACLARFARWANKKERLFEVYLKKLVSKILSVAAIRPVISAKEMPLNYLIVHIITLKYLPFTTSSYFRIVTVAIYELRVTCTLRWTSCYTYSSTLLQTQILISPHYHSYKLKHTHNDFQNFIKWWVLDNPLEATQIVCRADFWGRVNGIKSFNLIVLINDFFQGQSTLPSDWLLTVPKKMATGTSTHSS